MSALDDILGKFFGHDDAQATVVGKDGTTYGPAQARISKTPIDFTDQMAHGSRAAGEYDSVEPTALNKLLDNMRGQISPPTGTIRINPNSPSIGVPGMPKDLSATIRHEEAHALMDKLGPIDLQNKVASSPMEYNNLRVPVSSSYGGRTPEEVPAYALTQDPGQVGQPQLNVQQVPAAHQQAYVESLLNNIARINPQLAQQMSRLRPQ